jgi:hypothetical protein
MGDGGPYRVEIPEAAWLLLPQVPPGLPERVRAELERLAVRMARHPQPGAAISTMRLGADYTALVFVDHEARLITLKEVKPANGNGKRRR